jgi:hypothetical protein
MSPYEPDRGAVAAGLITDEQVEHAVAAGARRAVAEYAQAKANSQDPALYLSSALARAYFEQRSTAPIVMRSSEMSEDDLQRRIHAMQTGRSTMQAIVVDAGDAQEAEIARLKDLLVRYAMQVGDAEGVLFLDDCKRWPEVPRDVVRYGDRLTPDEQAEILTLVEAAQ